MSDNSDVEMAPLAPRRRRRTASEREADEYAKEVRRQQRFIRFWQRVETRLAQRVRGYFRRLNAERKRAEREIVHNRWLARRVRAAEVRASRKIRVDARIERENQLLARRLCLEREIRDLESSTCVENHLSVSTRLVRARLELMYLRL
jgi:hypothetical protein